MKICVFPNRVVIWTLFDTRQEDIPKPSEIKIYDNFTHLVFEYDEEYGCAGGRLDIQQLSGGCQGQGRRQGKD